MSYPLCASLLLSIAAYSTAAMSATPFDDIDFSVERVTGEMPIRSVVVKRTGEYFTSFFAYQFDCASGKSGQTGFHSSPEAALADLSNTALVNSVNSSVSDQARSKACVPDSNIGVNESQHQPSAS